MMQPATSQPFEEILAMVEILPLDDQEWLIALLEKRYHEKRRAEIAANARQTLEEYQQGLARTGTVDELLKDLTNGFSSSIR